jgi:hypothetical protein
MIYGPDGKELAEALAPEEEGILQADVILSDIDYSKTLLDPRPILQTRYAEFVSECNRGEACY